MKEHTISLTEAQQALTSLCEQFSIECPAIVITREDQPVLTIMPYRLHQELLANVASLQTMLEIMLGGDGTASERQAKTTIPHGKSISWEEFQKEVGWE
jgi:hypothetical protein